MPPLDRVIALYYLQRARLAQPRGSARAREPTAHKLPIPHLRPEPADTRSQGGTAGGCARTVSCS